MMSNGQPSRQVSRHVSPGDLALYVMDALTPAQKDRVESHVVDCPECAEALACEAQLESAFEEIAARYHEVVVPMARSVDAAVADAAGRHRARRAWQHRAVGGVAGALAAAAAIVLALASNAPRLEPAGAVARGASLDADALQVMSAGVLAEPDYQAALDTRDVLDGG
jgi:anti-sigma factor RsiW